MQILLVVVQIHHRVPYNLPWPVPGNLAPPLRSAHFVPTSRVRGIESQVVQGRASPQGVHGRVLQQEEDVVTHGRCRRLSLPGYALVEETLLPQPCLVVRNDAARDVVNATRALRCRCRGGGRRLTATGQSSAKRGGCCLGQDGLQQGKWLGKKPC